MTEVRLLARTKTKSQDREAREQEVRVCLHCLTSGDPPEPLLRRVDELCITLPSYSILSIGIDFPFHFYFNLIFSSSSTIRSSSVRTFAFFAQTPTFPVAEFVSLECSAPLFDLFSHSTKRMFSDLLRLFTIFVRNSLEFREFLISHSIFHFLTKYPNCSRIPQFIESFFSLIPLPSPEVFTCAHSIFTSFLSSNISLTESDSLNLLALLLKSLLHLLQNQIPFDFGFLSENLDILSQSNSEEILITMIPIVELIPNSNIDLARTFLFKLGTVVSWSLLPPILHLFIAKHSEWSGFVDDELIESVLILVDRAGFREQRMIAHLLCLFGGEIEVCDLRIVREVAKFVVDEQIGQACIELLWKYLEYELSIEEKLEMVGVLDEVIPEMENLLNNDEIAADQAEVFLVAYNEWKSKLQN
jgi:hypothetical protein